MNLERWLGATAVLAGLLALVLYARLRALQRTVLREQARQLEQAREQERAQLDALVRQRTLQLTELTHHLQTAREDERSRLARNLHDDLGALLTSAKLDAARIRPRLAGAPPEALERLAHLVEMLNGAIALGRRIIEDLRPSTLTNLGLAATLEILAREFAERSGVEVHCALAHIPLPAASELVVYRLVQEAVTNISKYAGARHVWLDMAQRGEQVEVLVRDDGVGFDPAAKRGSAYGLVGMRYRVEAVHGTLEVLSAPGQGTVLRVRLPGLSVASYAA
ncbi:sensor histidine kinase [uncultured Sphaerotilus sp.]|uniref:sensor histidine kinase n=1 Tax=uncultured Sphaerotilus sp. TaxID=474984 RepID=UPI0030CA4648